MLRIVKRGKDAETIVSYNSRSVNFEQSTRSRVALEYVHVLHPVYVA